MKAEATQVWLLAGTARGAQGFGTAMMLCEGSGRCLASWRQVASGRNRDRALLLAIVEGMRQARENGIQLLTVLCPSQELTDRLNRERVTQWNEPVARLYLQARALSHAFTECKFRAMDEASASVVTRMAEESLIGAGLQRAA